MADVTNDRLVFHSDHMFMRNHSNIARTGNKNVGFILGEVHRYDAIAFHCGLQSADWIDFDDPDLSRKSTKRLGTAFAYIAVANDNGDLAGDHHVGGAFDAVNQGFAAAVKVVEL